MRTERTLTLADGATVTVLGARVREIRRLLSLLPPTGEIDWLALVRQHHLDLLVLLEDCLRLPAGQSVDDLRLEDAERVLLAWWELHQDFFRRALAVLGYELATSAASTPSSAPASR